jgi:DNA-binding CsgD family transcriptional regulator
MSLRSHGAMTNTRTTQTSRSTTRDATRLRHPSGNTPAVRQLVNDWAALAAKPRIVRQVNEWGLPGEPIEHLDDALERAGFGRETTCTDGDRYLAALVKRAKYDDLAGRIVLQRILPPLIAIAARRGRIVQGGFTEAFTLTVAQAWILIRTYPIERRPAKIASNLVRDAEYHVFVREARMKRVDQCALSDEMLSAAPAPSIEQTPESELRELLTQAQQHGLTERQVDILTRVGAGESFDDIAADYGVSMRTVRGWRREAIEALRERMPAAA